MGVLLIFLASLPQDETVRKLIKEGDALYAAREEEGKAAKAVEAYQKALALDDACVDAYWRVSRVCFWLGAREKENDKKAKIYRDGIDYAKRAIAIDKDCVAAHFWLGLMYGLYGEVKGVGQSLDLIKPMKQEMDWVLKHDATFESGGAHRVLGMLYHKLPPSFGGDRDKALTHLKKAVEIGPAYPENYLCLAQFYAATGKKDEAKASLKKLLELEDHPDWIPESKEDKKEAKALLEELEKK